MHEGGELQLAEWLERPEISARTVLVTILGDVVRPVRHSLWSSQLFELCEPFGFSIRLVRTSLSRLVSDGWVESERIGRQSKYSLTPLALRESAAADRRIYKAPCQEGDGRWTVVVIDPLSGPDGSAECAISDLAWQGLIRIGPCTLVSPHVTPVRARELIDELAPSVVASVAGSAFDDPRALVSAAQRVDPHGCAAVQQTYTRLTGAYKPFLRSERATKDPRAAYLLRVMLLHDLRRLVLRSVPIPRELLPNPWAGDEAFAVAGELYHSLCATSAEWLATTLDTEYPKHFVERFPTTDKHRR